MKRVVGREIAGAELACIRGGSLMKVRVCTTALGLLVVHSLQRNPYSTIWKTKSVHRKDGDVTGEKRRVRRIESEEKDGER